MGEGTGLGGVPYRMTNVDAVLDQQLRYRIRSQDLFLLFLLFLADLRRNIYILGLFNRKHILELLRFRFKI